MAFTKTIANWHVILKLMNKHKKNQYFRPNNLTFILNIRELDEVGHVNHSNFIKVYTGVYLIKQIGLMINQ